MKNNTETVVPIKPEGKHWLLNDVLIDHVVEDRFQMVNADAWVSHAENAVEFGGDKCETGQSGRLGEFLVTHAYTGNL